MGTRLSGLHFDQLRKKWTGTCEAEGKTFKIEADDVISSAPLREIAKNLSPSLPEVARKAADDLRYRDFITVALIAKERDRFSDNWIYIHDPNVLVGRIQNFKSWSPEMVPNNELACYGLEYFCFAGDGLWTSSDTKLIELARNELVKLNLAEPDEILDGCVFGRRRRTRSMTTATSRTWTSSRRP